jgi:DNA-binding NarL/FixJ family response regulator/tRNA A-37 threonylcarbamoyl transferase component Bud32
MMIDQKTSVLIAEDQDIARLGLKLMLENMIGIEVVGEAADGEMAINQAKELRPTIILMDIDLPGLNGISATKEIKKALPETNVIMFTSDSSDESIFAALGAGADGYCLKNVSADRLESAISSVKQGAAWLDPGIANRVLRANLQTKIASTGKTGKAAGSDATKVVHRLDAHNVEVLRLIETGQSLDQIARQLNISTGTLQTKVRDIFQSFLGPETGVHKLGIDTNVMRSSLELMPGTILGDRYIIEEAIGCGGMSTVYKAKHRLMERIVAIKTLHQRLLTEENQVKRFYQEAKAASSLNHRNIITMFDFGVTSDGVPFLVMDYIDGKSLAELLEQQALSLSSCLAIFIQVCDALSHAHKRGTIHRDLKPSNIMVVASDEENEQVKLVDFGIAKLALGANSDPHLTKTGELFGTPFYMSPEQIRGLAVDARSDIYSLGCVLYQALAGQVPFTGESAYQIFSSQVNDTPSRLPLLAPGKSIPAELEAILFKALAKDEFQRHQSALELKNELAKVLASLS